MKRIFVVSYNGVETVRCESLAEALCAPASKEATIHKVEGESPFDRAIWLAYATKRWHPGFDHEAREALESELPRWRWELTSNGIVEARK